MILTKHIFEQGKSSNGGWNEKQISILGESIKVSKWAKRVIGKEFTEEQINKFLALKDAHISGVKVKRIESKGKPVFLHCSSNIPYKEQYLHPNWQKMRLYILSRDNFTCVECGNKDHTLHVHHLKYAKNNFIWAVPYWYLVTLCDICHSKEHGRNLTL